MAKQRRSLEQMGKIEHLLKQKYGEEAIINPRAGWTKEKEDDYQKQLELFTENVQKLEENEEKIEKDGILVSKNLINYKKSESCSVCEKYLTNLEDSVYLVKFLCCKKCYVDYVEDRLERWRSGWRPQK